ncbi:hypothetical protein A2693_02285 [Candidatus Curtissbacteria bacterium RIFCSPHIGHO2_01_FULL_40_12]|uniref:NIF system FeS cluster assembly NifU N-terminal domain-containing protein n=1 Tax=Candidatus Curtissbacteria bacterium RIFCSPHIGHO2_01_FULL_40_12 TaxID=1797710 RepID=A0A1F5GBG5_9BACT|nr:MAG: hypothetical protein A2693_02285 [Candidatus Curtissbacteria bacterium RIFCSPHIGHO2_01_FULL_40_12]
MDIYREEILEHWKNPQNFGEIKNADLVIDQINPLCGDQVRFFFRISRTVIARSETTKQSKNRSLRFARDDRKIEDVSFTGNGCAISIASASILSEYIKNKSVDVLAKITGEKVLDLIGGSVTPARLKCAFLPLEAIRKVVESDKLQVLSAK